MAKPRRVRNFWLEAVIDGRRTKLKGGPMKTGGFELLVFQKHRGQCGPTLKLIGRDLGNGSLELTVESLVATTTDPRLYKRITQTEQPCPSPATATPTARTSSGARS
jgi:hypothetical protein